ncbi:hypothetical protein BURMUCGD2M_0086 [Burkholderia multivorans CGD2M]|uniref:Uncharacterized protein n=1 Tax=Burkholderia multivorans CGD2 TaxID=513052 RepID=B9C099_9BURK|nr:hypothetical protein BURMUCGD2_0086 [Burkholderia multivorans CGD2]EEE10354.1 hypothetical protein BURMUCGD2M_0086 [Burkholderia multivorans CGD2M]
MRVGAPRAALRYVPARRRDRMACMLRKRRRAIQPALHSQAR